MKFPLHSLRVTKTALFNVKSQISNLIILLKNLYICHLKAIFSNLMFVSEFLICLHFCLVKYNHQTTTQYHPLCLLMVITHLSTPTGACSSTSYHLLTRCPSPAKWSLISGHYVLPSRALVFTWLAGLLSAAHLVHPKHISTKQTSRYPHLAFYLFRRSIQQIMCNCLKYPQRLPH